MATEKFASISTSASGDSTIVAAVTGKKIRVLAYTIIAAGAVAIRWKSASTNISGAMSLAANGGASPACTSGLFETATAEALVLNLGGAVAVGGHVTYVEITP